MLFSVGLLLSTRSVEAYLPLGVRRKVAFALYSTSNKASSSSASSTLSSLYGGDFAGHAATFSSSTGKLIRVPDHLVPSSLIEWGQVPSCLEVLVSEDFKNDGEVSSLTRQTLSVVPEVGCGVDNLDTIKNEEVIDMSKSSVHLFQDDTTTLDYELPKLREDTPRSRIETTFVLLNDDRQRMRVLMDLTRSPKIEIQSPITLILERQTSTSSSQGRIADGGGLDARTVARLLGDELRRKPFADDIIERPMHKEGNTLTLTLPGNITIAHGEDVESESWILNVSHDLGRRTITRRFGPNSLHATVEYTR